MSHVDVRKIRSLCVCKLGQTRVCKTCHNCSYKKNIPHSCVLYAKATKLIKYIFRLNAKNVKLVCIKYAYLGGCWTLKL